MVYERHDVIPVFPARGTEVERLVTERRGTTRPRAGAGHQPSAPAAPRSGTRGREGSKAPLTSPGPSAPPRRPAAPPAAVPIFPHLLPLLAFLLHFLSGSSDQVKTRVLQRYSSFLWALTGCPGRCQRSGSPFLFHAMMQRSGLR